MRYTSALAIHTSSASDRTGSLCRVAAGNLSGLNRLTYSNIFMQLIVLYLYLSGFNETSWVQTLLAWLLRWYCLNTIFEGMAIP